MRNRIILSLFTYLILTCHLHSGGILLYEVATPDLGLASAGWSARAEDASTVFTNPAGMTRLPCTQIQFGAEAIYNHVVFDPEYSSISGGKGNGSLWIPSGSFFAVTPICNNWYAGIASVGYFGSAIDYGSDWCGRYYVTKTRLQGFSVLPSVAYRWNDQISFGIGANVMYGIFSQYAALNNFLDGLPDGKLSLSDERLSGGVNVGLLYEFSECTRFGLQYLSSVKFDFRDKNEFKGLGPTLENIFLRTGILNSTLNLHVRVPNSVMLSGYHLFCTNIAILGNLGWQQWSKFQRGEVVLDDLASTPLMIPSHYNDTWHVALGTEYYYNDRLKCTLGAAYDSSAISTKHRVFTFPVGAQTRVGTGVQYLIQENMDLSLSYEFLWTGNLKIHENRGILEGDICGKFRNGYTQFLQGNIAWGF